MLNYKKLIFQVQLLKIATLYLDTGWQAFHNDWEGSACNIRMLLKANLFYNLTKYTNGSAGYLLQWIYGTKLVLEANTAYTFTFDAYASKDIAITPSSAVAILKSYFVSGRMDA